MRFLQLPACLMPLLLTSGMAIGQSASAVFLEKDSTPATGYHAVYIERDSSSPSYRNIELTASAQREALKELRRTVRKNKSRRPALPGGLPRSWVPLYRHNGEYHVYQPCDGINLSWIFLNDSAIVFLQVPAADSWLNLLTEARNPEPGRFELKYRGDGDSGALVIRLIDRERHIAVFQYDCGSGRCRNELWVDAAMIRKFPLLVNDCRDAKQEEFQFDPIDFNTLSQ